MLYSTLIAATFAACAFAAPKITSPAAGASLPVSAGSITVEWEDDGEAPKISQLTSFTLQLSAATQPVTRYVGESELGILQGDQTGIRDWTTMCDMVEPYADGRSPTRKSSSVEFLSPLVP
jgi:hypothetical protein